VQPSPADPVSQLSGGFDSPLPSDIPFLPDAQNEHSSSHDDFGPADSHGFDSFTPDPPPSSPLGSTHCSEDGGGRVVTSDGMQNINLCWQDFESLAVGGRNSGYRELPDVEVGTDPRITSTEGISSDKLDNIDVDF
jgi:hypothetical protein